MKERPSLGQLVKGVRQRFGYTLKEMAEHTGIPFSTLAKVETDRLNLNYDKIRQICDRLNIGMAELFAEETQEKPVANSRRSIGTIDGAVAVSTPMYDYFYLAPDLRQKDMIPIFSKLKARNMQEFGEFLRHPGEEFIFVVKGAIDVHTEFYDVSTLREGESVYIDSSMGHAYTIAAGFDEAHILSVCSATQEQLLNNAHRD